MEPTNKKQTDSGIEIKPVYQAGDLPAGQLELPGTFPYTRGIQPDMYRGKLWTMRQYAGFSTAEASNERYHYLLKQGVSGLSVAFDLPTQIGYDSDHALADGEVGKVGVAIETLPGATAFVPALVNSGLPATRFIFEGFIPLKKGRKTLMESLANEERTMIFYESPMRLVKTLELFATHFGADRQASVSRELTKIYEENISDSLANLITHFSSKQVKGEIVIVVDGKN